MKDKQVEKLINEMNEQAKENKQNEKPKSKKKIKFKPNAKVVGNVGFYTLLILVGVIAFITTHLIINKAGVVMQESAAALSVTGRGQNPAYDFVNGVFIVMFKVLPLSVTILCLGLYVNCFVEKRRCNYTDYVEPLKTESIFAVIMGIVAGAYLLFAIVFSSPKILSFIFDVFSRKEGMEFFEYFITKGNRIIVNVLALSASHLLIILVCLFSSLLNRIFRGKTKNKKA